MKYIVLDLEFNQHFPFPKSKMKPISECPFEVIQIGAVMLDMELNIVKTADFLIRPRLYTVLHPYVKKLTDLSIEKLSKKPYFPEAYMEFIELIDNCGRYELCTWGNADISELIRNAEYYKLDTGKLRGRYINVQEMAARKLKRPRGMHVGLKNAVNEFELDDGMSFHDALNDAIYTAKIFGICRREMK